MICFKEISRIPQLAFRTLLVIGVMAMSFGCVSKTSEETTNAGPLEEYPSESQADADPVPIDDENTTEKNNQQPSSPATAEPIELPTSENDTEPDIALEDYRAVLAVTEKIKLHERASLVIWIGDKNAEYNPAPGTAVDTEDFPARIGQYARVKPIAPDFEISPLEKGCIRIDPSGSKVIFTLTALREGTFNVRAEIELYDNPNCEGTPVPKTTENLSVLVEVDKGFQWQERLKRAGEIFWDKFFSFWGALVALILGFVIYIIRKFLKKKTGFDGGED
ncbi:hypothetical protein IFO69_05025 [Echinicola sp. CAU 1574]|uniref:Uncharacterized protein n=1 Tax=Echinicola arenosa TaxID=2774144 RepID=A0ABR9AJV5_9BACT|nr:hypothetical protein [Echinicola arenosa]MBD8488103.1 hypothetical protein [Echinicola arenosa]